MSIKDLEKTLQKLAQIQTKAPNSEKKQQILQETKKYFVEKQNKSQGMPWWHRLTSRINQTLGEMMKKLRFHTWVKMMAVATPAVIAIVLYNHFDELTTETPRYQSPSAQQTAKEKATSTTPSKGVATGKQESKARQERREVDDSGPSAPLEEIANMQRPSIQGRSMANKRAKTNADVATAYEAEQSAGAVQSFSRSIAPRPIGLPAPTIDRDQFETFVENGTKLVSEYPISTFSVDVDTASYTFARKMINNGQLPSAHQIRVEEFINYFDYNYKAAKSKEQPFQPTVVVYPTPWNKNTKLMHIGIKGYELKAEKPAANLVFLIDTSGSMDEKDKLPLLISSFKLLLQNLDENDWVSIVTYAGSAGEALPPTQVKNQSTIMQALNNLRAGGSTAGGQGINLAYSLAEKNFDKNAVNRIILATDGDFNVGISDPSALENLIKQKRQSGIFLSVLGFGSGNYNDHIMQKLAQNGNGNAAYIDSLNEAQKVLVDEASSTLFTIAKDVKIQVEFNPKRVAEYKLIGYETRALKREDFNNDAVDAGDIGSGHTVTAIYEITEPGSAGRKYDDVRYLNNAPVVKESENNHADEYAFLKMRYKLPKQDQSKLITTPITETNYTSSTNTDIKFAAAVAGFALKLKNSQDLQNYSYDQLLQLATQGKGKDGYGYRADLIKLIRLVQSISNSSIE
ncbi:MAG: VWA domain-containing protein [Deltaproteobacteria bacterium]|nr:VWA domain-containing protein [Deltaproteobacteria bacterium]